VGLPVVAIGGITLDNAPSLLAAGVDALAVITAGDPNYTDGTIPEGGEPKTLTPFRRCIGPRPLRICCKII
jgi:hypothetical protein